MSVEADIFNVLKARFNSQLSWVKKVNVDTPIIEVDALQNSDIPLIQIFWDGPSSQQPQRGKTLTEAPFMVQLVEKSTSSRKVTQQMVFDERDQMKEVVMGSIQSIKAENKDFIDFGYSSRIYDIHSVPNSYLAELRFIARFNESYGQC